MAPYRGRDKQTTMIRTLNLSETEITDTYLLDWLTSPERDRGVNKPRYWFIKTDTQLVNVNNDTNVSILSALLSNLLINNYEGLMIIKNNDTTTSESRDSEPDTGTSDEEFRSEVPPTSMGV